MSSDRFDRDLRAVLAARAPDGVPATLNEAVARLDPAAGRGFRGWLVRLRPGPLGMGGMRALGPALAVVLVVAVLGAAVLHYAGRAPLTPGAGEPRPISWTTNVVSLEADAIVIQAGDAIFTGSGARFAVHSDEGGPSYRTLEVSWLERGVEMRLNLYFEADEAHWWVSELRTYDGLAQADWITYPGPLFRTARGEAFTGNVELSSGKGRVPGRLRVDGLRLVAFVPGTGPRPFEGCRMIGPDDETRPAEPMDEGQPLAGSGLLGMSAGEARDLLTGMGICHDFRLMWMYQDEAGSGYSQRWCAPPPGEVEDVAYGYEGHVILFVRETARRTFDPNTPQSVGCS